MKPDPGLIFAVRRIQTGAHIHKINNWLHQYVLACHTENRKLADEARLELIAFTRANRRIRWRWDEQSRV